MAPRSHKAPASVRRVLTSKIPKVEQKMCILESVRLSVTRTPGAWDSCQSSSGDTACRQGQIREGACLPHGLSHAPPCHAERGGCLHASHTRPVREAGAS